MISREQRILEELRARLNGAPLGPIPRPPDLKVDRSRLAELKPQQMPHVSLYPLEAVTTRKGYLSETGLTVRVAVWVKGEQPLDAELDPLWLWIHQQLIGEESLGGLATRVEPLQKVWSFAIHREPVADLDLHYLITFRHQANNPSLP